MSVDNNWLSNNWHYLSRVIIAGLIVFCIGAPLVNNFIKALESAEIQDFISITVKEKPLPQTKVIQEATVGARDEDQSKIETAHEFSTVPSVWAYGLRIFGVLIALVCTLWSIVALCWRD